MSPSSACPDERTGSPVRLPVSAELALWIEAHWTGRVGPDEVQDALLLPDGPARILGWSPGSLLESGPAAPELEIGPFLRGLRALAVAAGDDAAVGGAVIELRVVLPVPGDPSGLRGPVGFNEAAVDAGEALVVGGSAVGAAVGLIPDPGLPWHRWVAQRAEPPYPPDVRNAGAELRRALLVALEELAGLQVARWQPEIPDLVANLRHRPGLALPPGLDRDRIEILERAALCAEIVDLAAEAAPEALSASDHRHRQEALRRLDQHARAALAAAASASLSPS